MSQHPIVDTIDLNELDSCVHRCTLLDENEAPVPAASLTALTLTLYGKVIGDIINSRNAVSVFNANGGTYHATSGAFDMHFAPEDSEIQDAALTVHAREVHHALFVATWDGGLKRKSWIVRLRVRQLQLVP